MGVPKERDFHRRPKLCIANLMNHSCFILLVCLISFNMPFSWEFFAPVNTFWLLATHPKFQIIYYRRIFVTGKYAGNRLALWETRKVQKNIALVISVINRNSLICQIVPTKPSESVPTDIMHIHHDLLMPRRTSSHENLCMTFIHYS